MVKIKKEILAVALVFILFIASSYLTARYKDEIGNIGALSSNYGVFLYVLAVTASIVIAPLETLPLLPVAVALWGPLAAAVLSIIGWMAGALIAFLLARRWGQKLVCRLVNKCDLEEYHFASGKNVFLLMALARIVLPVDIVSYAIGLFTNVKLPTYFFATLIGITPFAFVFAYGSRLALEIQVAAGSLLVILFFANYKRIKKLFAFKKRQ